MAIKDDILNELNELSPLIAGIEKVNVFSVPDGYFNDLDEVILAGIKEHDIVFMNGIKNETFFEAPNGYFENLADNILAKIKKQQTENASDELRKLSPMLYSIQNEKTLEAPAGYFESLAVNILAKVRPQHAKIVTIHKRRTILKYAAAAMITGSMALGIYKFIQKPGHNNPDVAAVALLAPSIQTGIQMNETQFNDALNNLSQDDIANYLEKNANDEDVAALSSGIDENTLPAQSDYLSDDKTLDNYLNDINNTTQTNN